MSIFKSIEKRRDIRKSDFRAESEALRQELVIVQQRLRQASYPVIVVFAGVDGAGKHESADLLNEWMDPRWLRTHAYGAPSDEERERPEFWRYWRDLPQNGLIGLYLSAWYSQPLLDRVKSRSSQAAFGARLDAINRFERMLADDGALIVKYWMHLDKNDQRRRLEKLAADPLTAWEVAPKDWEHWALYGRFVEVSEALIGGTDQPYAPWRLIDASAERLRGLDVAHDLLARCNARLQRESNALPTSSPSAPKPTAGPKPAAKPPSAALAALDLELDVSQAKYRRERKALRARLGPLQRAAQAAGVSSVLVFEGWDAAGKGGAIRRIVSALDARRYRVIPIAAPTDEELAHHYLWRFWRHLPRAGRVTIFDRSWYGRVLVERIEGYCSEAEWRRAYDEINAFEAALTAADIVICKFWLHISPEEQLARFQAREQTPYKAWKLTDDDWRNRERWDDYAAAVDEMVARTSTARAPWTLVEANSKSFARLKIMRTVCERLEAKLGWDAEQATRSTKN